MKKNYEPNTLFFSFFLVLIRIFSCFLFCFVRSLQLFTNGILLWCLSSNISFQKNCDALISTYRRMSHSSLRRHWSQNRIHTTSMRGKKMVIWCGVILMVFIELCVCVWFWIDRPLSTTLRNHNVNNQIQLLVGWLKKWKWWWRKKQ